eukprot:4999452-Pyramimonas_sp.AAC.1
MLKDIGGDPRASMDSSGCFSLQVDVPCCALMLFLVSVDGLWRLLFARCSPKTTSVGEIHGSCGPPGGRSGRS